MFSDGYFSLPDNLTSLYNEYRYGISLIDKDECRQEETPCMAAGFSKHNVPQVIIRRWSEDKNHVDWYNPVTKEEKKERTIASLYTEPLTGMKQYEMSAISYLEGNFTSYSKDLYTENFVNLRTGRSLIRSMLLFLYLCNPVYQNNLIFASEEIQMQFDLSQYSGKRLKTMQTALHSTYVSSMLKEILLDEFTLYDLEPVLLKTPPSKSFVLGGNPVIVSNPFLGKEIKTVPYYINSYLLKGTVIILPLSPDRAFCLYDKGSYSLESDVLSPDDTDIINREEIYCSGEEYGIVTGCEKEYIEKLFSSIKGGVRKYGVYSRPDLFPFDVKLSVLGLKGQRVVTMRDFAHDVRAYDQAENGRLDIRKADSALDKRYEVFKKRFRDGVYTG